MNRFRLTTGEKPAEISSVYTSANNRVALFQQPSPSLAEPSFKQWHSLSHAVHTHIHIRTHTHTHTHKKYTQIKESTGAPNRGEMFLPS